MTPVEGAAAGFKVIRDPLWNNIQVGSEALELLDSEPLQRLRYIRQLGHAFLVYPGATHTRFEHALGTYHLASRALSILRDRGELGEFPDDEPRLIRLAALLHDVGHYPFSHALEEAGLPSHEDLATRWFEHGELRTVLERTGVEDAATRLTHLITGRSESPLGGLISGSLDLDKIEYLTRDARMTGVPYGAVDVDRLLHSLTVARHPNGFTIGVREKGVSALESLLFARYQMYRNVYWHHAVRSATAMFKRAVRMAIRSGTLSSEWIADTTDDPLMERLRGLPGGDIAERLRHRRLFKRILEIRGDHVPHGAGEWIAAMPSLTEAVEDHVAAEIGLSPGDLLIDFPAKERMLHADLPLVTSGGRVESMGDGDPGGRLGIQGVAEELYAHARRLRIFAAEPRTIDSRLVMELIERDTDQVRAAVHAGHALVS